MVCELFICKVCGCMEGSLLPVCPGRRVSMEEQDRFYAHYCAQTGPFARLTRETATAARQATYVYMLRQGTLRAPTRGSQLLYDAVYELWKVVS